MLASIVGVGWLVQSGAVERAVRSFVDDVQSAALFGLNRLDPGALDGYFATEADGGVPAGLAATQQAYKDMVAQLPGTNSVQFHSFDILALEVHEDVGLAKVTYRLHFCVVRGGLAVYSAKATQDIAPRNTIGGWRISGGDAP